MKRPLQFAKALLPALLLVLAPVSNLRGASSACSGDGACSGGSSSSEKVCSIDVDVCGGDAQALANTLIITGALAAVVTVGLIVAIVSSANSAKEREDAEELEEDAQLNLELAPWLPSRDLAFSSP